MGKPSKNTVAQRTSLCRCDFSQQCRDLAVIRQGCLQATPATKQTTAREHSQPHNVRNDILLVTRRTAFPWRGFSLRPVWSISTFLSKQLPTPWLNGVTLPIVVSSLRSCASMSACVTAPPLRDMFTVGCDAGVNAMPCVRQTWPL